jgi:hypothetical protein
MGVLRMRVFSYWSGPVSWMQRLSVASAVATGHDVTVFSYDPHLMRGEFPGASIEDAREVMDDPALAGIKSKLPDHFADHFRVEALAKCLGTWADLDIVFLRPVGSEDYLLGDDKNEVCNAILKLPADSHILADYLAMCRRRPIRYIMPWWTPRKKALMTWKRVEKWLTGKPPPRLQYGPPMLTHLTGKHDLWSRVAPQEVVFPVPSTKANVALFADGSSIESFLTDKTRTVHLWSQYYKKVLGTDRPKADTWLGRQCNALGV